MLAPPVSITHANGRIEVELPVLRITTMLMGTSYANVQFSILLTSETEKPIPEFADEFWEEFRSRAIRGLKIDHFESRIKKAAGFLFCFYLLMASMILFAFEQYTCVFLINLTIPWFIHCRLCDTRISVFYAFLNFFLCFQYFFALYVEGVILMVLIFTTLFCAAATGQEKLNVTNLIDTINLHHQDQLSGFSVKYISKKIDDNVTDLIFVFKASRNNARPTGLTTSQPGDQPASRVLDEDESQDEIRVFIRSFVPCKMLEAEQRDNYSDETEVDQENNHMLFEASLNRPSGVSFTSWTCFVEEISTVIESHDAMSYAVPFALIIHVLVSIAYYAVYDRITWLLPLHLTPPLLFNKFLQDKFQRKFEMIEAFGGSSLFQLQYEMSYHSVLWYSRSRTTYCSSVAKTIPKNHTMIAQWQVIALSQYRGMSPKSCKFMLDADDACRFQFVDQGKNALHDFGHVSLYTIWQIEELITRRIYYVILQALTNVKAVKNGSFKFGNDWRYNWFVRVQFKTLKNRWKGKKNTSLVHNYQVCIERSIVAARSIPDWILTC